jgi:hypothetical protein
LAQENIELKTMNNEKISKIKSLEVAIKLQTTRLNAMQEKLRQTTLLSSRLSLAHPGEYYRLITSTAVVIQNLMKM